MSLEEENMANSSEPEDDVPEEEEAKEEPEDVPGGFTPPSPESLMNEEYDDDWGEKI